MNEKVQQECKNKVLHMMRFKTKQVFIGFQKTPILKIFFDNEQTLLSEGEKLKELKTHLNRTLEMKNRRKNIRYLSPY